MQKLYILVICLTLGWVTELFGQDPRLAQFYAAPLQTNPAMAGLFNGRYRIAGNYRDLYGSVSTDGPYRTAAVSFDWRSRVAKKDYFSWGLQFMYDQAGSARFEQTLGGLTLAYHKRLGGDRRGGRSQFLAAGAQVGFGDYGLDGGDLWFSNQFDPGTIGINPDLPSGETGSLRENNFFLDAGAGLLYYNVLDEDRSFYLGGSLAHINQPNVSFLENEPVPLDMRWSVIAGGEVPFIDGFSLLPAALVQSQGAAFSTMAGANFRYVARDWRELALRFGLWAHATNQLESMGLEAITTVAIFELKNWQFGISYDFTLSKLQVSNFSRGGLELSFIYFHPAKWRTIVECPKY